jgi:hypothetical protein
MKFENPFVLWALLSLVIPVIIHLIYLQRAEKIFFSNTYLLQNLTVESHSKRKLKEWIILLCRLLAATALILAFAMPYFPTSTHVQSNANRHIFFDNSFSMQLNDGQGTCFDRGKIALQSLVKQSAASTKFSLLNQNFGFESQRLQNKNQFNQSLATLNFSPQAHSFSSIVQRLSSHEKWSVHDQLYLVSDFQKSTLGKITTKLNTTNNIHLIPIQSTLNRNAYVDSVWFSAMSMKPGDKVTLHFKMTNVGDEALKELVVHLNINDQEYGISKVSVEAHSSSTGHFELIIPTQNELRAVLHFDDGGLTFDNRFYFVIPSNQIQQVAIITQQIPSDQAKVFQGEEFVCKEFTNSSLNYEYLEKSDLIVIEGLSSVPNALTDVLMKRVQKGGKVCFIPTLNDEFFPIELAKTFGISTQKFDKSEAPINLNEIDYQHPFFKDLFDSEEKQVQMPEVGSWFKLNAGYSSILETKLNAPYFSYQTYGQGLIYVFHYPIHDASQQFLHHVLFAPIFVKMAYGGNAAQDAIFQRFNHASLAIPYVSDNNEQVQISFLQEPLFIPAQRREGTKLYLEVQEQMSQAGFYTMFENKKQVGIFALNYGTEESQIEHYSVSDLKEMFKNYPQIHVFDDINAVNFEEQLKDIQQGTALWKYLLILSLLFIALEIGFIRWYK